MSTFASLSSLRGRRALITGAAGGIGRVIAGTLAELGADLLLIDLPGAEYGGLVDDIRRISGAKVDTIACDLEIQAHRSRLVATVDGVDGGLDILINNAAFVGSSTLEGWTTSFERQSVETWRRAVEVNLTAVFDLSKGLAPVLRRSQGASIVNIASIYGSHGPDPRLYEGTEMGNPAAYAASKGGLIQLTRWMATTLAPSVRVNAISPGGVLRGQPAEFIERYCSRVPLARMATEDDLRGAVAFLATDLSRYVTGQNLSVDGGWSAW